MTGAGYRGAECVCTMHNFITIRPKPHGGMNAGQLGEAQSQAVIRKEVRILWPVSGQLPLIAIAIKVTDIQAINELLPCSL